MEFPNLEMCLQSRLKNLHNFKWLPQYYDSSWWSTHNKCLSKAAKQKLIFIKTLKYAMNCPFQIFHWTKMLSAELWISVCQLSLSPDRNFRAKVACWKLGAAFFWEKKCQPKLIQDIVWNNYMISRLCYLPNSCLNTLFAKRPFNKEYWIQLVFSISFAMSKGL